MTTQMRIAGARKTTLTQRPSSIITRTNTPRSQRPCCHTPVCCTPFPAPISSTPPRPYPTSSSLHDNPRPGSASRDRNPRTRTCDGAMIYQRRAKVRQRRSTIATPGTETSGIRRIGTNRINGKIKQLNRPQGMVSVETRRTERTLCFRLSRLNRYTHQTSAKSWIDIR